MMRTTDSIGSWIWKVPLAGLAHALGAMLGGGFVSALGLDLPRFPGEVDFTAQALLLWPGGMAFALGLAAMASGLTGRWWERWTVLGAFLFIANGVGNTIEATIFTTLGGPVAAGLMNLPSSLLLSLVIALLIPAPSDTPLTQEIIRFFSQWRPATLARRLGLAILAFPVIYFMFGMMIAPLVTPHYARLDFLVIPPMSTLLPVLLLRSSLLLLVSLPIVAGWRGSRGRLILGLGLGHFTVVGLGGLIQATFFPAVLRWAHGIEILADSLVYAWVLVRLLRTGIPAIDRAQATGDRIAAPSPAAR